jgi:hypothetical protein
MPVREKGGGGPVRSLHVPSHVPSHPQNAAKMRGFSVSASGFTAETDWLLEESGFEPLVPLATEMLIELARGITNPTRMLGLATSGRCRGCADSEVGPAVRILLPPAESHERTSGRVAAQYSSTPIERCFATAWRVMSNPWHSSPSFCPLFRCNRSSNCRRLASAKARNTASSLMLTGRKAGCMGDRLEVPEP